MIPRLQCNAAALRTHVNLKPCKSLQKCHCEGSFTNIQGESHQLVDVHEPHGDYLPDAVWQHTVDVICARNFKSSKLLACRL